MNLEKRNPYFIMVNPGGSDDGKVVIPRNGSDAAAFVRIKGMNEGKVRRGIPDGDIIASRQESRRGLRRRRRRHPRRRRRRCRCGAVDDDDADADDDDDANSFDAAAAADAATASTTTSSTPSAQRPLQWSLFQRVMDQ